MSHHTKGPWHLIDGPDGWFEIGTTQGQFDGHAVIASRNPWPSRAEESLANGRLLHAAPDLLAACKHAFQLLCEKGDPFAGDDWEIGHRLSAAIAKAETSDTEAPR